MELTEFIERTLKIDTPARLFESLRRFMKHYQVDVISYHIVIEHLKKLKLDNGLIFHCFPEPWVAHYRRMDYFDIDPIINHALVAQEPFHWFDIGKLKKLSEQEKHFLRDLHDFGLVDGFAIPIFGPRGTSAYFGLGSTRQKLDATSSEALSMQYACHQVHHRYLEIRGETEDEHITLSPREREVLQWMAKGKSNTVIAEILGISEHTVDTLARRCFAKLKVADRISAAIKGVGLGLISL